MGVGGGKCGKLGRRHILMRREAARPNQTELCTCVCVHVCGHVRVLVCVRGCLFLSVIQFVVDHDAEVNAGWRCCWGRVVVIGFA